jgi:lipopolysaccharide export system permease protein
MGKGASIALGDRNKRQGHPDWSIPQPVRYTSADMLRRCDRYVLREMVGPFFLALAGLVLFILLNIILSLSDLMVDRGVGMLTLLRLVVLKMPSLLVIAIPMSALFAAFLGLGRLGHDREIVALESIGIPLRRILLPLIVSAAAIGAVDFAIYNWVVPASEGAYQHALRSVIFRQGVPRITANTFFKGPNDQFFYIRRYDESTGTLYDVHIYDTTGRLFPQAGSRVTVITAEEGRWTGAAWELEAGNVYGFDQDTLLVYSGTFEHLTIPLDQAIEEALSRSRTPAEMGISELTRRISQARASGQRADAYVVEAHLKGALPLATIVFVLLGGAGSLAFGARSRAVGIVLGLLLVAVFQGVLWWTQTLGRRGAMNPALAAWVPDLVFGAVGVLLFTRVDRLASRDIWSRLRTRLPFALIILLAVGIATTGQDVPLHLDCDELFLSTDRTEVHAEGSVSASFAGTRLGADQLNLNRIEQGHWHLEASGAVVLDVGDEIRLTGERLFAEIEANDATVLLQRVEASGFSGRTQFVNSVGEEHDLFFRAEKGVVTFDEHGEAIMLEAYQGELTTCNCCGVPLREQPYTLSARRLVLYPEELLVVFGLTARISGVATFWLPFYVRPLEETLESPLFPAFGSSALRGWFVKWNLPFFLTENLYGTVLVDFFSRFAEIGVGGVLRYTLDPHNGRVSAYYFPAKVGDGRIECDLRHSIELGSGWEGSGRLEYEAVGDKENLSFSFRLEGALEQAVITVAAVRETTKQDTLLVDERIPEVTLRLYARRIGSFTVRPQLSAGWFRERQEGVLTADGFGVKGDLQLIGDPVTLARFSIAPTALARASWYDDSGGRGDQQSLSLELSGVQGALKLNWSSTFVHGSSPFQFDRLTAEHRLRWRLEPPGQVQVRLSGGWDFDEGIEPIEGAIEWGDRPEWRLDVVLDPLSGSLSSTTLRGTWKDDMHEISWKIPYLADERRFEPGTLDVEAKGDRTTLSFVGELDLNSAALLSASAAAEITTSGGWGISLGGSYVALPAEIVSPHYGLFRDIADCIRVGVERTLDEFWIYGSIIAFPEAILRYAPRSAGLDIGEP